MKLKIIYKEVKPPEIYPSKIIREKVKGIIFKITEKENTEISELNLIFCSDVIIRDYNKIYLGHDYETDIITFHDKDEMNKTEGELLISVETVRSNSKRFRTTFVKEIYRVIIHGVLHLCGYSDKTKSEKLKIRKKENLYLKQI